MKAEPEGDLERRRLAVQRRALANLVVALVEQARRSGGRLAIEPFPPAAALLRFADVRTLVRRGALFAIEPRDFAVVLACPPLWPLDREAALQPLIVTPDDFRHPNSDGRFLCLDLRGVLPEPLPGVLYDNLRLRAWRLDHVVDTAAADFVRAHLADFPADPRPLLTAGEDSRWLR